MKLTRQERQEALTYAFNGATFYFVPSEKLSNMVIKGHPMTQDLNDTISIYLIQKDEIRLETNMVVNYCKYALDEKNTWLLDQGDIKVIPRTIEINKGK